MPWPPVPPHLLLVLLSLQEFCVTVVLLAVFVQILWRWLSLATRQSEKTERFFAPESGLCQDSKCLSRVEGAFLLVKGREEQRRGKASQTPSAQGIHRVTESQNGWKGLKDHLVPITLQGHLPTPCSSNLALNTSRAGASTTSLDNLSQCLTILIEKNFFLLPFCPVLSLKCTKLLDFFCSLHKGRSLISSWQNKLYQKQPSRNKTLRKVSEGA